VEEEKESKQRKKKVRKEADITFSIGEPTENLLL
jgi:hypothetical protein